MFSHIMINDKKKLNSHHNHQIFINQLSQLEIDLIITMILKLAFTDRMSTPQLLMNSSLNQINFSLMHFYSNEIRISSIRHPILFTHRTFRISFKTHKIKWSSDENNKTKNKFQLKIIFKSLQIQSYKIKIN